MNALAERAATPCTWRDPKLRMHHVRLLRKELERMYATGTTLLFIECAGSQTGGLEYASVVREALALPGSNAVPSIVMG